MSRLDTINALKRGHAVFGQVKASAFTGDLRARIENGEIVEAIEESQELNGFLYAMAAVVHGTIWQYSRLNPTDPRLSKPTIDHFRACGQVEIFKQRRAPV